jgi:uncharacterized protein
VDGGRHARILRDETVAKRGAYKIYIQFFLTHSMPATVSETAQIKIVQRTAKELGVGAISGSSGGSVARRRCYRKAVTGNLDDTHLRNLEERLIHLRELEDRRAARLCRA